MLQQTPLKIVILAAFKAKKFLGEKEIITYVLELAEKITTRNNIYIVLDKSQQSFADNLQKEYKILYQQDAHGTGDAIRLAANSLTDFSGDIFILYGDTPLFRFASLLGMLTRHQLKSADLTLFTAISSESLPYGRIVRDAQGQIIDIIENDEASESIRTIRELNLGAYLIRAEILFYGLKQLFPQTKRSHIPITDIVHPLIRAGNKIESYQSHDPDEILGINTKEDLEKAEFILQKRHFRPSRAEEEREIHFGTGGWRAVIGEGFTMQNVRRLSQALANKVIRSGMEKQGVLIGYDRRFLADRAAKVSAEVFAGNNIPVILLSEDAPTPLVTYATDLTGAALGLVFTASHNPPEWNGLKVFHADGSLLMTDETNALEKEANSLRGSDVVKLELDMAEEAGIVRQEDFTNAYVDAVESLVDMQAIRDAGLRVVVDPMFGVGQATLNILLTEARCRVNIIHGRHDALFGGRSPAPKLKTLRLLMTTIKDGNFDIGLAMDGDADRIAIVDESGKYVDINNILLLLYHYLHEIQGLQGGVVRNLATTHLLDRLAAHLGEKAIETPVGFKHIIFGMQEHKALLGGESSGGLTIRGHILGKDGILAAALMVEMIAKTGKKLSAYLEEIYAITGRLYSIEENAPATSEMKIIIPKRLQENSIEKIGSYPVLQTSHFDGTKFLLENDNWLLLRFSGTEPLLRIFAEADTPEKAQELIDWGKAISGE